MKLKVGSALVALLVLGAVAPGALASTPPRASVQLYLPDAFFVHGQPLTVPGRFIHLEGVVRPYVGDQWVDVRVEVGSRLVKSGRLRLKPSPRGLYGAFTAGFAVKAVGPVRIEVVHARTSGLLGFRAVRSLSSLDERIHFGSTGRFVQLIQQRLAALHFYLPQTGVYDAGTGLALDAYHRLLHWGAAQTLDSRTVSWLLNGWGAFPVRFPSHGKHVEGNLSSQLLALTYGSRVYRIYPMSSGKASTPTILGSFHVYMKEPGLLPDGMYYSSFFSGGYAVHGYNPAPDYPASHGCMRVPIADAISIYDWLNVGDGVDVYR